MNLVPFLMSFLASRAKLAIAPITAAGSCHPSLLLLALLKGLTLAQCLYVLTDDNFPAVREVRFNAGHVSCLMEIAKETPAIPDERTTMLRVLAAGVLSNISPLPPAMPAAQVDIEGDILLPLLQPIISSISLVDSVNSVHTLLAKEVRLSIHQRSVWLKLCLCSRECHLWKICRSKARQSPTTSLRRKQNSRRSRASSGRSNFLWKSSPACVLLYLILRRPFPREAKKVMDCAYTFQDTFILTMYGADDDDMQEDDMDGPDAEDADSDVEEEAELMTDEPNGLPSGDSTFAQLSPLLEPLLHLAQPTALSFPPPDGPSPHPPTTSALGAVHICALECLNNLFLGLGAAQRPAISANSQAGTAVWGQVWAALQAAGTIEGAGQERRRDMWETGVGVLWGVASVWKGVLVSRTSVPKLMLQAD
jgi:hypothetical protein